MGGKEGLPVHRLLREKRGSVYAYSDELDIWWNSRKSRHEASAESPSEHAQDLEQELAIAAPGEQRHPEIRGPTLDDRYETDNHEAGEPKPIASARPRHIAFIISVLIFIIGLLAAIYGARFRESMRMRSGPSRIRSLAVLPLEMCLEIVKRNTLQME